MNDEADMLDADRLCLMARYCQTHTRNLKCIQPRQVTVLISASDDWLLKRQLEDERNLFLLLNDALAATKLEWPDFVIHGKRLYRSMMSVPLPDELDSKTYFGLRLYEQVMAFDRAEPYSLIDLSKPADTSIQKAHR